MEQAGVGLYVRSVPLAPGEDSTLGKDLMSELQSREPGWARSADLTVGIWLMMASARGVG